MSFAARMTRCPRAFDAERGEDVLSGVGDIDPALRDLLLGTAGSSPYLAGLIVQEADWLMPALADPEAQVQGLLDALPGVGLKELPAEMRRGKRRIALITALADLGGVWPLETVTQTLTDFAFACVDRSIKALVAAEIARGKLPGLSQSDEADAGGMVALAMGKMGAGELNYSSDIDLICLFDETRFDPDAYHDARASFIRVTRRMHALLSDVQDGGYVFRTDLRLRPDAAVTPVCLSMEAAERYYESVGRTWERAAYIKAAPCGGDLAAGNAFLDRLRPFIWRKHLDFAAIQDAHDMRLRIRDHKGLHGPLVLQGHNMKLGRGGIREIEFFTQTRQLIAGGRDPSLRVRGTREGLDALAQAEWIDATTATTLYDHYRAHREVEHRLQMINDAQTHSLPTDDEGFRRLACLMGTTAPDLCAELTQRIEAVHDTIEGFFAPAPAAPTPDWGQEVTQRWRTYPALRSPRASEIFRRLTPEILERMQDAAKPDEALSQFDAFLAALPAGVQLFSLFEANPQLTKLIVDICATAPALAQYLSRNAGVLDAVIGGAFFDPWPGADALRDALSKVLNATPDYEAQLVAARSWQREWHFRIGVHHLRGLIGAEEAGAQYADLAEAVLAALWPCVVADFARKHGPQPGRGAVVLGMGSLGARRLSATSDVDLIVIYEPDGQEASEGRRPLATRPYYARLTQSLVTAITAPMAQGRLYEVDMRLRPSGRQGPVATSWQSFRTYQREEAWTWEHLALTHARPVAGVMALGQDLDQFRRDLLAEKGQGATVLADVAEMRARLAEAKPGDGPWDMKLGPGRMQDIALLAETAALRAGSPERAQSDQIAAGVADGWLDAAQAQTLQDALGLFWQVQAAARLLTGGRFDPDEAGEGGRRLILRETGFADLSGLVAEIATRSAAAAKIITDKIGAPHEG